MTSKAAPDPRNSREGKAPSTKVKHNRKPVKTPMGTIGARRTRRRWRRNLNDGRRER